MKKRRISKWEWYGVKWVPKEIQTKEIIETFYPETVDAEDEVPDYNFILRHRELNPRSNS